MKKLKTVALITGMALCLGGGIGAALAAITESGATSDGPAAFDKAINLYWGAGETTATLADMTDLTVNDAQYRYLSVTPKSTKSVSGTVTVSFTLALGEVAEGTATLNGLQISVYKTTTLLTDDTVEAGLTDVAAEFTLNSAKLTDSSEITVTAGQAAHETNAYYAIEVLYDGTDLQGNTLAASLSISQSFSAAE